MTTAGSRADTAWRKENVMDGRSMVSVGNRTIKVVESGVSSRTLSVAADKFL